MIRPGDRGRVLAYLDDRARRGFGVTASSTLGNCPGLQRGRPVRDRLRACDLRSILDGLVAAGVATVALEPRNRHAVGEPMRVYRAVAATNQIPPRSPIEKGARMK